MKKMKESGILRNMEERKRKNTLSEEIKKKLQGRWRKREHYMSEIKRKKSNYEENRGKRKKKTKNRILRNMEERKRKTTPQK